MKIPAVMLATRHNISNYPSIQKHNALMAKCILIISALGIMLPFVLPHSPWLADAHLFQQLGFLIPAAGKLAEPALHKNLVFVYVNTMLVLAFLLSIWTAIQINSWRELSIAEIEINQRKSKFMLWLKALLGMLFLLGGLALFYIFPGRVDGSPAGSRGDLIVSLMVMTKSGLAIFGTIASAAIYCMWCFFYVSCNNFLLIPFIKTSCNSKD